MASDRSPEAISAHLARLLREAREEQKISLNSLAQQAGVSRQTIRFIEKQERHPTVITLLRITAALGVKAEDLITNARRAAERPNTK